MLWEILRRKGQRSGPRGRLCQDVALLAQLPVLTPQAAQFLALHAAQTGLAAALIAIRLAHPVPDCLRCRLELTRQFLWRSARADLIAASRASAKCARSCGLTWPATTSRRRQSARVTRSGCLPTPGPDPGDLFKSLPAYKKLHPKE